MMFIPGVEEEFSNYIRNESLAVDERYKEHIKGLKPGTKVRYYKQGKDNTLSKPTAIVGKHTYEYNADKDTCGYGTRGSYSSFLFHRGERM